MKKILKKSMKQMLIKYLAEFSKEKDQSPAQVETYANNFVNEYERYLNAYNEFKED